MPIDISVNKKLKE